MKINFESQGFLGANCYMVQTEKAALVIDPFNLSETLRKFLLENSKKEIYILATHRHCDHIAGIADVKAFCGGTVAISKLDECGLQSTQHSLGDLIGVSHKTLSADVTFSDGDVLTVGDINIEIMITPGHTEGSACFKIGNVLFSGDTLFHLSIGRTDFPSGSASDMKKSLHRLLSRTEDLTVYSGHGESTTLFYEKQNNPYYLGSLI